MTPTYCPPSAGALEQLVHLAGDDRRDAPAAVQLAQAAHAAYDPEVHGKLTPGRRHHELFREVAFERFANCRNVGLASRIFDVLIARQP